MTPTFEKFLENLANQQPLRLKRGGKPGWEVWQDADLHNAAYAENPALYALVAFVDDAAYWQRVKILYTLLEKSRIDLAFEVRQTLERVSRFLLAVISPDHVLSVFLALRQARANHKHTTKAVISYLFNHPESADLAIRRRPAVVDCVEHALGKNVARGCAKLFAMSEALNDKAQTYLRRNLLSFAQQPEQVRAIFLALYQKATELEQSSEPSYLTTHEPYLALLNRRQERPKTVTATNRGDIAATLVHIYRGGTSGELEKALEEYVEVAAAQLPRFEGKLALVLDTSGSTRGYGDREFCGVAQSVALQRILAKNCQNLQVYGANEGAIPYPSGATDLASGLLTALEGQPDLVAIVSDGYENSYGGDLARVAASLATTGIQTPVVFCHSKFTRLDDLSLRRPAPNLPQLEFWHQDDFESLMLNLMIRAKSVNLAEFLIEKIARLEKEVPLWT